MFSAAAAAQDLAVSENLVPLPNHWTTNGQSVNQTYAINQALSAVGAGVIIHGFDYGYQYNLGNSWTQCTATNQDGSCSWWMTFNPRVDVNVSIRSNTNTQIYGVTHTEIATNTGNSSRDFQYRFADPRDILTLGNFNYTASTSQNATVFGMYSRAVYAVNPCVANPQSSPSCPGYRTYYNIGDDSYAIIPLPFGFPLYGRTFTHSIMFDNGVVSFYDPVTESARLGGQDFYSQPLSDYIGSQFYYSIMPLWTDLEPNSNTKLYTQTDSSNYLKYTWEDLQQWGYSNRLNTFSLEIRPSGYLGIQYAKINIDGFPITAGAVGNAALGEWTQTFHGSQAVTGGIAGWSQSYTQPTDCSNPLNHPACPGYADAYHEQQCAADPLYSTSCAGYATAFHDQQCAANVLYATTCPGYQQAYYDQQCSLDPLYDGQCPGYAAAYYDQQCSINALYDTGCSGYQQAYHDQQCGLDPFYSNSCPGYATAFFDQQCGLDPFYSNSCPGYQQAYYNQQCAANPLYDSGCPNHDIVLAATQPPTVQESATAVVALVDTSTAALDTTSPTSVSPAAVISVLNPPAAPAAPAPSARSAEREAAQTAARAAEQKAEGKKTERAVSRVIPRGATGAAAARAAAEKADEAVADAATATTMEAQQAAQNTVLGLMGYNPAFSAYQNAIVPDTNAAVMARQYNQPTQDNRRALRALSGASDRVHQDMVDQQYGRMP